jgi:hypothetical protein
VTIRQVDLVDYVAIAAEITGMCRTPKASRVGERGGVP